MNTIEAVQEFLDALICELNTEPAPEPGRARLGDDLAHQVRDLVADLSLEELAAEVNRAGPDHHRPGQRLVGVVLAEQLHHRTRAEVAQMGIGALVQGLKALAPPRRTSDRIRAWVHIDALAERDERVGAAIRHWREADLPWWRPAAQRLRAQRHNRGPAETILAALSQHP